MSIYLDLQNRLQQNSSRWLVTGAAGFIGCNLVEALLKQGQRVVGIDNFSTGRRINLDHVMGEVGEERWKNFRLIEGDICTFTDCVDAVKSVDYVLHEAALGSVPRSIADPIATNQTNINGFLNMLTASKGAGVKRFVYAASSSTYGDHPALPKVEDCIGKPLSPYAVTKYVNELYAEVFARTYGFQSIGLRYFNVFGPHQNPDGAYAAVIPKWILAMINGDPLAINGDGETSRDFCFVANVIQANLLAATTENPKALNQIYNVAVGNRTTLNELHGLIKSELLKHLPQLDIEAPEYKDFRSADVRHSLANIDKATTLLGYQPTHNIKQGMAEAMDWYIKDFELISRTQNAKN